MSRTLGFCLLSAIPLLMYDVVAYLTQEKYAGSVVCIGTILVFFAQILKIFA